MTSAAALAAPHRWWTVERERLTQDLADLAGVAPDLAWVDHGTWVGAIPLWPFDRPAPAGLRLLLPEPLQIELVTSAAHPLTEPAVYPTNVDPGVIRRLDHRFHLSGDGRLCLTQGPLIWQPHHSLGDLILKAASWRCEFALLEVGAVSQMTENGIVNDASRDYLFGYAAQMAGETW